MNQSLPYQLRHSPRAKRLRLVVKPEGAELVMPPGVGEAQALAFLERHRAWAERKLAELQARRGQAVPPQHVQHGATVPFQGQEVPVLLVAGHGRRLRVAFDGHFVISAPGAEGPTEPQVRAALFAWVREWLLKEAGRIVEQHADLCGLHPGTIRVKCMTSRWGSCGARGDINLNWLLAFAPPSVLEYVVVHELCHLRHRDHSAAFWNLVARHLPDWPEQRQWLRRQGIGLLRRLG